MTKSQAGDIWMELVGNIVGFGWVFGCSPPEGEEHAVTEFQHVWWVNKASFWNCFYPGLIEELAVVPSQQATQSLMVSTIYPLLRGAAQQAARDHFGEKLWIDQSRPEPLFLARAVGGQAFVYPVEPCVGQALIVPTTMKPDVQPLPHGPHIGSSRN